LRQIEATDGQIDALVYELYGLTGEEIRIVEGGDHLFADIDWIPVLTPTPHGAMRLTCRPAGTEVLANLPADVSIRTIH